MSTSHRIRTRNLIALAIVFNLAGCSQAPLTAPLSPGIAPPGVTAPAPPSRLSVPTGNLGPIVQADSTAVPPPWQLIRSVPVVPGVDMLVTGSHYELRFAKGSLSKSELITIKEYDPNVLDVQFGPHGTRFVTPVELSIDFAGTAADPRSVNADNSEPVLWYLNETTNHWEEVQGGTTDWVHMKYIVHLEHFSRYVLGGKAGWKHSPNTENDN